MYYFLVLIEVFQSQWELISGTEQAVINQMKHNIDWIKTNGTWKIKTFEGVIGFMVKYEEGWGKDLFNGAPQA